MSTSAPLKPEYALADDELGAWVRTYGSGSDNPVSPKVKASAAAAAVATAVAAVCAVFGVDFELDEASTTAVGSVLTLAVFALGYWRRDPLRD